MIVPDRLKRFHIVDCSPEGLALLDGSEGLRHALEMYVTSPEPEKVIPAGAVLLGTGRYGFAFRIADVVLKVTSPTSSQQAFDQKRPFPPEDLTEQFRVMGALAAYLGRGRDGVTAPSQFFVARTPLNTFVLGQQLLNGWVALEDATEVAFPGDPEDPGIKRQVSTLTRAYRDRLARVLEGFPLRDRIDDLGLHHKSGIHGTNLLVPPGVQLGPQVPLCIVDQPGHPLRESAKRRTST